MRSDMKYLIVKFVFLFIPLGFVAYPNIEKDPVFHSDFITAAIKKSAYSKHSETNHVDFSDYFDKNSKFGIKLRTVSKEQSLTIDIAALSLVRTARPLPFHRFSFDKNRKIISE